MVSLIFPSSGSLLASIARPPWATPAFELASAVRRVDLTSTSHDEPFSSATRSPMAAVASAAAPEAPPFAPAARRRILASRQTEAVRTHRTGTGARPLTAATRRTRSALRQNDRACLGLGPRTRGDAGSPAQASTLAASARTVPPRRRGLPEGSRREPDERRRGRRPRLPRRAVAFLPE